MKCGRVDCKHAATKFVHVSFASKAKPDGPRVNFKFPHALCDEHATTDPDAYISDDGWEQIESQMKARKLAKPDRDTVQVSFTPYQ